MSYDIPTVEPDSFILGDTVKWTITLADWPATLWTLKYSFMKLTTVFSVSSSADGDSHAIVISKTTSSGYTSGVYLWQSYVENIGANPTERYSISNGSIELLKTYVTNTPFETRSTVKIIFDDIEAMILGRATNSQASRRVGDRELRYLTPKELIFWRNFYLNEYNKEIGKGGQRQTIKVEFASE